MQSEQPRRQLEMIQAREPSQECLVLGPVWLPDRNLLFTATWAGLERGIRAAEVSCEQRTQGGVATASPPIQIETSSTGQVYILCHGFREEGLNVRLTGMPCSVGVNSAVPWNDTVYSAKIDKEGVYVWAKGPYFSNHLKPGVPCNVTCSFYEPLQRELLELEATTCGQEVVLCPSPPLPQWNGAEREGGSLWVISLKKQGIQLPSVAAIDARDSAAHSSSSHGEQLRVSPKQAVLQVPESMSLGLDTASMSTEQLWGTSYSEEPD